MKDTAEVFEKYFNGHKNLVTPTLMRYEQVDNFHLEVTKGYGLFNTLVYGLTVIEELAGGNIKPRRDLSGAFFEKKAIKKYIDFLARGEIKKAKKFHGRHVIRED